MDHFADYLKQNFPIVTINLDDDQFEDYDTNQYFQDMRGSHDLTVSTMERGCVMNKFKGNLTHEGMKDNNKDIKEEEGEDEDGTANEGEKQEEKTLQEKPDYIGSVVTQFEEDEYCVGLLYAQLDELHAIIISSAKSFI